MPAETPPADGDLRDLMPAESWEVVKHELARRDDEVERLRGELAEEKQDADRWHRRANRMRIKVEQVRAELTQRAEQAEDRLRSATDAYTRLQAQADDAAAARDRWQKRAEQAEAAIERVRAAVAIHPHAEDTSDLHHGYRICSGRALAALDAPSGADSPAEPRTGVPRHTDATREAGEAQEAAE